MSLFLDNLRTATVLARRNRLKHRTAKWWHDTHCPNCSGGQEDKLEALRRFVEASGGKVIAMGGPGSLDTSDIPDKQHH